MKKRKYKNKVKQLPKKAKLKGLLGKMSSKAVKVLGGR